MKEQIKQRNKRSEYYEILDLPHTCSSSQIKRAYRKLALRFHPDKNQTEGSKQVFNQIAGAYLVLNDPSKKAEYDSNRHKQTIKIPHQKQSKSAAFYSNWEGGQKNQPTKQNQKKQATRQKQNKYEEFARKSQECEDEFWRNLKKQKQWDRERADRERFKQRMKKKYHEDQLKNKAKIKQSRKNTLFAVLVVIIIALVFCNVELASLKPKNSKLYSLSPTISHFQEMKTQTLNVEYFVSPDFFHASESDQALMIRNINKRHIEKLKMQCQQVLKKKRRFEEISYHETAGQKRAGILSQAKKVDESSCNELFAIFNDHPEYASSLYENRK